MTTREITAPEMTAIEMTGRIDEHRKLILDGLLPSSGSRRVKVIVLSSIDDEIDENLWMQAAARNPAFDFLYDPEEDIYSITDGQPFHDKI